MTVEGCIKITKRTFKKKNCEYLSALEHKSKPKMYYFQMNDPRKYLALHHTITSQKATGLKSICCVL